jgi:HEAT repeat protein
LATTWDTISRKPYPSATDGNSRSKDIQKLIAIVKGKDWQERGRAASSLGEVGGAEALNVLRTMAKDHSMYVRHEVAQALGRIGGPQDVEILFMMTGDDEPRVREAVAKSLAEISNRTESKPILKKIVRGIYKANQITEVESVLQRLESLSAPPFLDPLQESASERRLSRFLIGAGIGLLMIMASGVVLLLPPLQDWFKEMVMPTLQSWGKGYPLALVALTLLLILVGGLINLALDALKKTHIND